MERRQQMDTASVASIQRRSRLLMKATAIFLILAFSSFPLRAQGPLSETRPLDEAKPLDEIKQLIAAERWQDVVRIAETVADRSADLNYYYGISLARLERWGEARMAFQSGLGQQPRDKRFLQELAGVAFRQKNYSEAADYLRRSL